MDIYAIVTDKIINLLEQGVVPWRRPWTSVGLPRNLVSKKPYRDINHFLLSASNYVSRDDRIRDARRDGARRAQSASRRKDSARRARSNEARGECDHGRRRNLASAFAFDHLGTIFSMGD